MAKFTGKWIGADKLLEKFDTLIKTSSELPKQVPVELVSWQREDMHRHYPNVETTFVDNNVTATTEVWPRSRTYSTIHPFTAGPKQHTPRVAAPRTHTPKTYGPKGGAVVAASVRPILREELVVKLRVRMVNLMYEAWQWP